MSKIRNMEIRTYSRRLPVPFHGMLPMLEIAGGVAESSDGLRWKLYVAGEVIVSHTGLPEIQYGFWSAREGGVRARVRGTFASSLIDALESCAARVPFTARDTRTWLARAAWGRPEATGRAFQLYPEVMDRDGPRVARVKARLLGGDTPSEGPSEPFYPFCIE